MKYLLDTDIASYYLRGKYNLIEIFEKKGIPQIRLSIISLAELEVIVYKNPRSIINYSNIQKLATLLGILNLDRKTWQIYSMNKANTLLSGKIRGDLDILQASIAKQHGLVVVTNNTKHFEDLVDVENWVNL